jgi:DNA-binding transcriptional MerR regulator
MDSRRAESVPLEEKKSKVEKLRERENIDKITVNCYIKNMEEKKYSIEELAGSSGFSIRTIRYYIQEGLLDPPPGRGRGGFYFDSHIQRLREIKTLQDQGLKLASIQEILRKEGKLEAHACHREVWIKYTLAPGIEVHVSRDSEEQERRKISEIIRNATSILNAGGGKNE